MRNTPIIVLDFSQNFCTLNLMAKHSTRKGGRGHPRYVKSRETLIGLLGITHTTINKLLRLRSCPPKEPGRGYDVSKFRTFAQKNISDPDILRAIHLRHCELTGETPDEPEDEHADPNADISAGTGSWKSRKERAAALKLEHDLKRQLGQFIEWDDYVDLVGTAISFIEKELRREFESALPPKCEGLSALKIRKRNMDALDKVLGRFKKRLIDDAEKKRSKKKTNAGRPHGT